MEKDHQDRNVLALANCGLQGRLYKKAIINSPYTQGERVNLRIWLLVIMAVPRNSQSTLKTADEIRNMTGTWPQP
jgi:hypothetical protein